MQNNTTIEGYKNYYGSVEFQKDFMSWFTVSHDYGNKRIPFVGFATRRSNPNRKEGLPSENREKSFYFSFCVFFHCLQAQAIFKLGGRKKLEQFHSETGAPWINCGLGGVMHPSHTLLEAELLPNKEDTPAYVEMIDTILPAIRSQVEELGKYADVDVFYSYVEREILAFRERLANGESHPAYLEMEI